MAMASTLLPTVTSFTSTNAGPCETQPLLCKTKSPSHNKKKPCHLLSRLNYRLPRITSKGAVVMIVWNLFFTISFMTCISLTPFGLSQCLVVMSLSVLYPAIGWFGDTWSGKYALLQAAQYFLLVTIICQSLATFVIPSLVVSHYVALVAWSLSMVCYSSSIFQFTLDQSIGASGEELSFTIYWILWGLGTGTLLSKVDGYFEFAPFFDHAAQLPTFLLPAFFLSTASFAIAYILLQSCTHLLMTKPQISNPIKHIYQVLNYARKHRYPEQRSALTYWEEDYPSRIDLGKDKYGGPFTFEEVEDVKTILRLLPVIVCVAAFGVAMWHDHLFLNVVSHDSAASFNWSDPTYPEERIVESLLTDTLILPYCITAFGVPLYHFLVYPFLHRYIPSMLRRIGWGLFLIALSYVVCVFFELLNSSGTSIAICGTEKILSSQCLWMYLPKLILAMGFIITMYSLGEFVIAQSPWQAKGLVLCILVGSFGLFSFVGIGVAALLERYPIEFPLGPSFYSYVFYLLGTIGVLIMFIFVTKWYKLRQRDDIVPFHMLAENYFEKNYKLEAQYWKAYDYSSYTYTDA